MALFWEQVNGSSGLQEDMTTDEIAVVISGPHADPMVLKRVLFWWEARWWTQQVVDGGNRTPNNWHFRLLAVEGDTFEPPPPGPDDPIMQGMMTATGPGTTFPASSPDVDVFQSWMGSSGAQPMDVKSGRAAVNYSGGIVVQMRFQAGLDLFHPEAWWWFGPWLLNYHVGLLWDNGT